MSSFDQFSLKKQLNKAVIDLGFTQPTPIQEQSFNVVLSGKDILGIAQTGTGKTMAYLLPILEDLTYADQMAPRVLIVVPTRELVVQAVDDLARLTKYMNVRVHGIYGGVNINTQRINLMDGADIIVATPGRLYDLALSHSIPLKAIKKLVIDEVDVMLDLGFRPQIMDLFELLPPKRQNILFSATMTTEVEELIQNFFTAPQKISIAVSGTPLENISQSVYKVENFYTKIKLLKHLLSDREEFKKVIVFASSKRHADKIFAAMEEDFGQETGIIHSNKAQSTRLNTIESFDNGENRILVATDLIARGLDLEKISHVINLDTPMFPENYMHRIGRTGRAEEKGASILFYTDTEEKSKLAIEELMDYKIPVVEFPSEVEIDHLLLPEEKPDEFKEKNPNRNDKNIDGTAGFHEKKLKNQKVNLGGKYKREIVKKYKKAQTRGDKTYHKRKKNG
ncbi:MAG: ATP-dependent RNA helicase RhlE [Lentimonas sp.]|jgi:ATP-dependent RNA helicase RhlE